MRGKAHSSLIGLMVISCLVLTGCETPPPAPIQERTQPPSERIRHHYVNQGETLYSIAWRYDLDFRQLAAANMIDTPYTIFVGQKLNLDTDNIPIAAVTTSVESTQQPQGKTTVSDAAISTSVPITTPKTPATTPPVVKPVQNNASSKLPSNKVLATPPSTSQRSDEWWWPVNGRLVKNFNPALLSKGIVIKTSANATVNASRSGVVVYAGTGLRDYGLLIIVKHSDIFLSAYAHNETLLVKEGDKIAKGQAISKLGKQGLLYFEIREKGKPKNPTQYLRN